jgi:hypothetical protein
MALDALQTACSHCDHCSVAHLVRGFDKFVVLGLEGFIVMVHADLASLKDTKPHEFALRFLFGGLCTVAAGLIAKRFGPGIGGLFLAFPAIFPAGASLIESHEKNKKEKAGVDGTQRGRAAASVDAVGASIGCVGLLGFALVIWCGLPHCNPYGIIASATLLWFVISISLWLIRRTQIVRRMRRQ